MVLPVVVLVPKDGLDTAVRWARQLLTGVALVVCACLAPPSLQAEVFHDGFDGPEPSWQVRLARGSAALRKHVRDSLQSRSGRSEMLRFTTSIEEGTPCSLELELPPARVLDELTVSLWVRSDRPGSVLGVRVVFPNIINPKTEQPCFAYVTSEAYRTPGHWQQLICRTTDREIAHQLGLLRAQFDARLVDEPGVVFIDRAYIGLKLSPDTIDLALDDLEVSPYLPLKNVPAVEPAVAEQPPVEFRLDKLFARGAPIFPRIIPLHGEPLSELQDAQFNTVWAPDLADTATINAIRRQGLWITASPPRVEDSTTAGSASLAPFGDEAAGVLFWTMGARIPASSQPELAKWITQVQQADRAWNRPIAADVLDEERLFSRHVNMLGVSRHALNGTLTLQGYRTWLSEHRNLARPGTFCWTWIQTEPSPDLIRQIPSGGEVPFLEPEQIRLQMYAALMAGCRGIGFWSTNRLDPQGDPLARERWLAIKQLNLELKLLEPWLATSMSIDPISFTLTTPLDRNRGPNPTGLSATILSTVSREELIEREQRIRANKNRAHELTATVMRTDYGTLVLPAWLERHAQFCPDQLAGNDATIVIPGAGESSTAWEITTTGIANLVPERVPSGQKVTLRRFDQTAAILLTSDQSLIKLLERKAGEMAETSARISVELAELKLERVRAVDSELKTLGSSQSDAPRLLASARDILETANQALRAKDWPSARLRAGESLQLVRLLQRRHWYDAVRKASPVSSPYTMCFQTLPDHWRMVTKLGKSPVQNGENLLPSGEFDDIDTLVAENWQHNQSDHPAVQASAELKPQGYSGSRSSLQLSAHPRKGHDVPRSLSQAPVTMVTPPLLVRAGQLVHISGWVRVPKALTGDVDGLMIYDSLLGKAGALRVHEAQDWRQFELYREVRQSGPITVTMALHGLGEVQIDRLKIVAIDRAAMTAAHTTDGTSSPRSRFLGLPRLIPARSKSPDTQPAPQP